MFKSAAKHLANRLGYKVYRTARPGPPQPVDPKVMATVAKLWPIETLSPLIRAGGDRDGAYLIPDDLDGISALFSPGVDKVSQFEADMAERGMTCYLADASVDGPATTNSAFRFLPKFLGLTNDDKTITLDQWVDQSEPGDHDLMLQMDIEGFEWPVLANLSDGLLARFRVMVIEFHWITQMFDGLGHQIITEVFNRLAQTHHVVHNHPNNWSWVAERNGVELPDLLELTLLRKDRPVAAKFARQFPHELDIINVATRPEVVLPATWYAPPETKPVLS